MFREQAVRSAGRNEAQLGHQHTGMKAGQQRISSSLVQFLLQCIILTCSRSSKCAPVINMEYQNAAKLEEEMWSRYSCNGTEKRRAQACIKDGEKLSIWLRRQMRSKAYEALACYADKAAVKYYVKTTLPDMKTATTFGVFTKEKLNDLLHHPLPPEYAMKATHGSNMSLLITHNHVYSGNKGVLYPSQKVSRGGLINLAKRFTSTCFRCKRQAQYRLAIRAVIVEEFIGMDYPTDYKVYVFNGTVFGFDVRFARVVDEQRGSLQMKTIRISNNGETELNSAQISKHFKFLSNFPPDISLQQILRDAKVLGEGFRFVRVDFYYVNNTVYFGELTMSPMAGSRHLDSWFRKPVIRHLGLCEPESESI